MAHSDYITYEDTIVATIHFTEAYGVVKVDGSVNGFAVTFSYVQTSRLSISASQAEYYLRYGYIRSGDVTGSISKDGGIAIGSKIKFSTLKIGGLSYKNIQATVVSNDNPPFVFGGKLFGKDRYTIIDRKRQRILLIKRTYYRVHEYNQLNDIVYEQ